MNSIAVNQVLTEEHDQFRSLFPNHGLIHSEVKGDVVYWTLSPLNHPRCPSCGSLCSRVHDKSLREIRDVDYSLRKVVLRVHLRRVRCTCGSHGTEKIEWLSKRMRVTNRLVSYAQSLLSDGATVSDVSKRLGLDWALVKKMDLWRLELEFGKEECQPCKYIALDEFSVQKKHRYATVACDLEQRKVLWVNKGKTIRKVEAFFKMLKDNNCDKSVQAVAVDMSNAFPSLIDQYLNADIVYDQFHVLKHFREDVLRQARIQVFSSLSKNDPRRQFVAGADWVIISAENTLDDNRRQQLEKIREMNCLLSDLAPITDQLRSIWSVKSEFAARINLHNTFNLLYQIGQEHKFAPAKRFADMLKRHEHGLLRAHRHKISTSVLEGINNTIKVIKRNAYGYRDFRYFALKIKAAFPGKDYVPKLRKGYAAIKGQWVACRFVKVDFMTWTPEPLPPELLVA